MSEYSYTLEKFSDACRCLAIGKGDVRSRLYPAYKYLVAISSEPEKHLPPELVEDFRWVMIQLTHKPEPAHLLRPEWREGDVKHTLNHIYNKTAIPIATQIWDIWEKLRAYYQ